MTSDDLRDCLAIVGASINGDDDGQRIIRDNADTEGLIDALVMACDLALRLLAKHDGVSPAEGVARLQRTLRTL